jgi:hypothetical protein
MIYITELMKTGNGKNKGVLVTVKNPGPCDSKRKKKNTLQATQ